MPQGERETHPYLQQGKIDGATRLILGSFPVYECTNCDNSDKKQLRGKNGIRFFYGSDRSQFWEMYKKYIDSKIRNPWNPDSLISSLHNKQIAISDTIISAERIEYDSSDLALRKRKWNREIINDLIQKGVTKIICTSKEVLDHLETKIICPKRRPFGKKDNKLSAGLQSLFLNQVGGDHIQRGKEIAKVFEIANKEIKAIAIPSPGSPQRKIFYFGCNEENGLSYAEKYFGKAFNWLME